MFGRRLFLLVLIFSTFFVSAQTPTDFEIILRNSIKKLFNDPNAGIRAAKNFTVKENDVRRLLIAQNLIATGNTMKGNFTEAVKIIAENPELRMSTSKNSKLIMHLTLLQVLQELGLTDQTEKMLQDLEQSENPGYLKNMNAISASKIQLLKGEFYFSKNNFGKSEEVLQQSRNFLKGNNNFSAFIIDMDDLLLLGKIKLKQKNALQAEKIATEINRLLTSNSTSIYMEARYFVLLYEISILKNEKQAAEKHLLQALKLIENTDYLVLKTEIYQRLSQFYFREKEFKNFEIYQNYFDENHPKIEEQKKEATRNWVLLNQKIQNQDVLQLQESKRKNLLATILFCSFLLLGSGGWYYQEMQKRKIIVKHISMMENQVTEGKPIPQPEEKTEIENTKKALFIPKETEDDLLQKLTEFEKNNDFLESTLSLASVAAQLGTNTKYLSEIVNKYKGKSFTTYINKLRIDYITNLIDTDATYHQYKISYLAELAGFITHSTFTVVFKSVMGISPNAYIQLAKKNFPE